MQKDPFATRDSTFDILKGITILLVIIGHCYIPKTYGHLIGSFHMPLFFLISGYFSLKPISKENLLRDFKRLLVPYFFFSSIICLVALFIDISHYSYSDGSYFQKKVIIHLLGYNHGPSLWKFYDYVDVIWFLPALFWAKAIASIIYNKVSNLNACIFAGVTVGCLGMILHHYIFAPFFFFQGTIAVPCVLIGILGKKYNVLETGIYKRFIPSLFFIWILCLQFPHAGGMWKAQFGDYYILNTLGALGATLLLYHTTKTLSRKTFFWQVFENLGKNSLVILGVHAVEKTFTNWTALYYQLGAPTHNFLLFQLSTRVAIILLCAFILCKIKQAYGASFALY
ncbi:acyltransferase family protein [Candidatus Saccharibacteria bacterium]|nr:acyltransferase family protein [Candidatus Saccharibacteria bacterium]